MKHPSLSLFTDRKTQRGTSERARARARSLASLAREKSGRGETGQKVGMGARHFWRVF
jgi:hypothetical protein